MTKLDYATPPPSRRPPTAFDVITWVACAAWDVVTLVVLVAAVLAILKTFGRVGPVGTIGIMVGVLVSWAVLAAWVGGRLARIRRRGRSRSGSHEESRL